MSGRTEQPAAIAFTALAASARCACPYVWLLLFFLAPFLIILKISVAEPIVAQPPFTPLLRWGAARVRGIQRHVRRIYAFLFQDGYYGIIYLAVAQDGGDRHGAVPAARLPDGVLHRASAAASAASCCCSR